MNEHSFVRSIHRQLKKQEAGVMIWKIHDNYQGGVPDAFYRGSKESLFVEYKVVKSFPKRPSTLVIPAISSLQKQWIITAAQLYQKVWVVVGSLEGIGIFRDIPSLKGICRKELTLFSTKEFVNFLLGEVNNVSTIRE